MTMTIGGTSGLVFPDSSTQNTAATGFGFKNRIINGAMMIDQRNAGASVTPTPNAYTLDRWRAGLSQTSKFSIQQNAGSVTPPIGFTSYLGVTSLSSYSITSGDLFLLSQPIEGLNISDLEWGTDNASTVTLSFWVRSSLTGTFGGSINNNGNTRSYVYSYTINSANTWEYKTVTITGDTTGTWLTTNGTGMTVRFSLGVGSTNSGTAGSWSGSTLYSPTGATSVVGTNGATFYITGVQLEKGSTATSFDYRPYGTEFGLCQRYYQDGSLRMRGYNTAGNSIGASMLFNTAMRASPTVTISGGAATNAGTTSSESITPTGFSHNAPVTATGSAVYVRNFIAESEL